MLCFKKYGKLNCLDFLALLSSQKRKPSAKTRPAQPLPSNLIFLISVFGVGRVAIAASAEPHHENEHHPHNNQQNHALLRALPLALPLASLPLLLALVVAVSLRPPLAVHSLVVEHVSAEHLREEIEGIEVLLVVKAIAKMLPVEVGVWAPPVDSVGENVFEAGPCFVLAPFVGVREDLVGRGDFLEDFFSRGVLELVGVEL